MDSESEKQEQGSVEGGDGSIKKRLASLMTRRNMIVIGVVLLVAVGSAGGWLFLKTRKKPAKEEKPVETVKPPLKITSDYFENIVFLGPYDIRLGAAALQEKPEAGKMEEGQESPHAPDAEKAEGEKESSHGSEGDTGGNDASGQKSADEHATAKEGLEGGGEGQGGDASHGDIGKKQKTAKISHGDTLKIQIAVEMNTPELGKEIETKISMVEGDISAFFKDKPVEDLMTQEGMILYKNELIAMLNKMLDSGKVRDIYFTVYYLY
jgi:flagellar basal body-associated protein FliL